MNLNVIIVIFSAIAAAASFYIAYRCRGDKLQTPWLAIGITQIILTGFYFDKAFL